MFKKLHGKFIDWLDAENMFHKIVTVVVAVVLVAAAIITGFSLFAMGMMYITENDYVLLALITGVVCILLWTLTRFVMFYHAPED